MSNTGCVLIQYSIQWRPYSCVEWALFLESARVGFKAYVLAMLLHKLKQVMRINMVLTLYDSHKNSIK